jgi:hypothetical protein
LPLLDRIYTRERWQTGESLTPYQQIRVDLARDVLSSEREKAEAEGLKWAPEETADSGKKLYQEFSELLRMNPADIYTLIVSP